MEDCSKIQIEYLQDIIPNILYLKLVNIDAKVIDDVLNVDLYDFQKLPGVGRKVIEHLIAFQKLARNNPNKIIEEYEQNRIQIIPFEPSSNLLLSIERIIKNFFELLVRSKSITPKQHQKFVRERDIIFKYYGFESKKYTFDELSLLYELTRERTRQIKIKYCEIFNDLLLKGTSEFPCQTENSVREQIISLKNDLAEQRIVNLQVYTELLNNYNSTINSKSKPYLEFFNDSLEISERSPLGHLIKENTFFFIDLVIDKNDFFAICHAVYLSIENNVLPIELDDIVIEIRRKLGKVDKNLIELACRLLNEVEQLESRKYQIKFEKLSSANDMAYRILFEKNECISLDEILREINFRLNNSGRKRITRQNLNTQMNMDPKLIPKGKTSIWGLEEWVGNTDSWRDLIIKTLTHFNKPCSFKEILEHIKKDRPLVNEKSLNAILSVYYSTHFFRIDKNKIILAEWKDQYKNRIIEKQLIRKKSVLKADIIANHIEELIYDNENEILLSGVVNRLKEKYNYHPAFIYKVVSQNEKFVVSLNEYDKKTVSISPKHMDKVDRKTSTTSVFVSYSWESEEHKELVISFVEYLRKQGFNADFDIKLMQEESSVDFNKLMHKGILKYDKVIIVLSPTYKSKAEDFSGGVGEEYRLIINDINKNPKKYILTSFNNLSTDYIDMITPGSLKGRYIVDLKSDQNNNFIDLFSKLKDSKPYHFSEVATSTPTVERKKIKPFKL